MLTAIDSTQAVTIRPEPVNNGSLDGRVCAGYTLQERLGVGGYGEVWRAIGPGGLHKAVKILHGFQDGPQAELELKSLERIRDLRHPFLLNIERIEVADGRLVIVSELAEGSLEDRFEQLRQDGRPGIPRDELLACLRDAADALDFMYEQHGLQHLDIKPANLLLQGGRVKVADFGLIKDVRQTHMSIVGGFTPRFAPPELFEGRPGRSSDQYSLAIVYQYLVTGTPPFAGRTTAQLAAQHLSSPPDLSPLNPADRPIVGRALSKSPHARFPSCRAFVDQLSERAASQSRHRPAVSRPMDAIERDLDDTATRDREQAGRAAARSIPLTPIPPDAAAVRYRPTLIVGLGGLGGAVLRGLRRRLQSQFGSVPAVKLFYIDTDVRAVSALLAGDDPLRRDECECLELRRPEEYRRTSRHLLEWLSRRWLFNIPRSGQVQGMRPLGRLALVDHQERIRSRLQECMQQVVTAEALEASRAVTGLPFEPLPPDIVLVAAVSGGTGGGAVLDTAYMLQQQLAELGLEGGCVLGLLLHATAADSQLGKVQRANALSSLQELRHFYSSSRGYPGDAACRLPRSSKTPFDHVYFVHLGEGLADGDFDRGIENVCEYLYRGTLTPARGFLEACRASQDAADAQARGTFLRSFGVSRVAGSDHTAADRAASRLCRASLHTLWAGSRLTPDSTFSSSDWADVLMTELGLRSESVQERAAGLLGGDLGQQIDRVLRGRLATLAGHAPLGTGVRELAEIISRECRGASAEGQAGALDAVLQSMRERLAAPVREALATIRTRTLVDSSTAGSGLSGALQLTRAVGARAERLASAIESLVGTLQAEQASWADRYQPAAAPGPALYEFGMLAICTFVHAAAAESIHELRTGLSEWEQTLTLAGQRLQTLDAAFSGDEHALPHEPSDAELDLTAIRQLHEAAADLFGIRQVDPLAEFVRTPPESLGLLAVRLSQRAASLAGANRSESESLANGLTETKDQAAASAWPFRQNVGGGHRVLAMTPAESMAVEWKRQLEDEFGPCVTVAVSRETEPFLCCESQEIDYRQIESYLSGNDDRIAEMAGQLHTRADIQWQAD